MAAKDPTSAVSAQPANWNDELDFLQPAEILESIDEAFYAIDHDWRILYANRKALNLWGKTREEVLNRRAPDVFPALVGSPSYAAHEEAFRTQQPVRVQVFSTVVRRQVEISIFPSKFGLAAYFRDVTEKWQTEQALHDRDQILTLAEQSAGIGVWDADLNTGMVRATPQFYKIMGLPISSEPVHQDVFRALRHPEDRARVIEGFRRAINAGADAYETEYRIIKPDGELRWIFGRGRVVRDADGKPVRYSGVDVDITDRKQAEARLQESEQRFRLVFHSAPNAMLMLAPSGQVLLVNHAASSLFGCEEAELSKLLIGDLVRPTGDQGPLALEDLQRLARQGDGTVRELSAMRKDGSLVPIEAAINHVRTGDETVVLAAIVDVSDRKRADQQRELLLGELDHRIKNIFAVISAMIALSARHAADPHQLADSLRARINSLSRAHNLIRGAGVEGTVTVKGVMDAILEPYADEAKRVEASGPDIVLSADFALGLSLIAHELLTNAVKYGSLSVGGGKVSADWSLSAEGERLRFRWVESGGPVASKPARLGFGSTVLNQCARGLGGEIVMHYAPEGLAVTLEAPL